MDKFSKLKNPSFTTPRGTNIKPHVGGSVLPPKVKSVGVTVSHPLGGPAGQAYVKGHHKIGGASQVSIGAKFNF